ncbi:hypothetical protein GIB67_006983 [Kingdonia uniflora]|uniref:Chlorophyll a-b binding protein, chloroplastic n=1 Tax=Kingdonia uniflora TaxID=39325 RepID=A0A7J7NZG1_9MAGN|nr:hypothetical protein GIB67_006983 [Kingdonia uniflora]
MDAFQLLPQYQFGLDFIELFQMWQMRGFSLKAFLDTIFCWPNYYYCKAKWKWNFLAFPFCCKYEGYELIHSKWAMLSAAGFIIPKAFKKIGANCGPKAVRFKTGALLLDDNTLNYFEKSIPINLALAIIVGSFVDSPLNWKEIYPKSKG